MFFRIINILSIPQFIHGVNPKTCCFFFAAIFPSIALKDIPSVYTYLIRKTAVQKQQKSPQLFFSEERKAWGQAGKSATMPWRMGCRNALHGFLVFFYSSLVQGFTTSDTSEPSKFQYIIPCLSPALCLSLKITALLQGSHGP